MGEVIGNLTTYAKMFHGNSVNKGFERMVRYCDSVIAVGDCNISRLGVLVGLG